MKLENFIAYRYLISEKSVKFVTIISIISIVGVTIGVAALIIVLSVFNGFGSLVSSILINFDPHLRIERNMRIDSNEYSILMEYLSNNSEVKGHSPYVDGKALVVSKSINRVVNIRGIEGDRISKVSGINDKLVLGSADLSDDSKNQIILGFILADRLGVVVGDTISVISPAGAEIATMQLGLPLIRRFKVIGIYESNNKDYDGYYAFTNLKSAQFLFNQKNRINGVDIRFYDFDNADKFKKKLNEKFGNTYRYLTWYDLHKELFNVMQLERWGAYIVLCLIIAVASFNLLSSLTMTVIEKKRDIGILKAMGAQNYSIKKIFSLQGLFIGIIGTLIGILVGIFVVYLQEKYHLVKLDTSVFIIPAMPVMLRITDIIIVAITAIGLCSIASRIPARRAANLDPIKAIQWE